MRNESQTLEIALAYVRERMPFVPKAALVLGSGLGGFAESLSVEASIAYGDIPGFPVSGVQGHKGRYVFAKVKGLPLVIMQGRVHYYEGYSMGEVVLPIRLMKQIGADILLLTNAAGGVNKSFRPGDLMMITDQISSMVPSPLIGKNLIELGERFPDMSQIYSRRLQELLKASAKRLSIDLQQGVYMQFTGPNYESPAEVAFAAMAGADAVGMSTACEAIAAAHMRMEICGISCITNMASGLSDQPLSHQEVQEVSLRCGSMFASLLMEFLTVLAKIYRENEK